MYVYIYIYIYVYMYICIYTPFCSSHSRPPLDATVLGVRIESSDSPG